MSEVDFDRVLEMAEWEARCRHIDPRAEDDGPGLLLQVEVIG
jgi:hypothetical protein